MAGVMFCLFSSRLVVLELCLCLSFNDVVIFGYGLGLGGLLLIICWVLVSALCLWVCIVLVCLLCVVLLS